VLPVFKKINMVPDDVAVYQRLKGLPYSFLLDSAMPAAGLARYSFAAGDPFLVFRSTGRLIELCRPAGGGKGAYNKEIFLGNPFEVLGRLLCEYALARGSKPVPFVGGAVGYWAYDLGRQIEKIPERAANDQGLYDCWLGFYDTLAAVDHAAKEVYLVSTGFPEKGGRAPVRAAKRLAEFEALLAGGALPEAAGAGGKKASLGNLPAPPRTGPGRTIQEPGPAMSQEDYYALMEGTSLPLLRTDFTRAGYCAVVDRAREYIAAGDIFQVNLSQRFCLPAGPDPWTVYRRLREINPAPMAAFLNFGDLAVVSASPERFLKVTGRLVETRPIKGTRPRGGDPAENRRWRNELWNSAKDRAELVMIVDLERNDLGRVCRVGSVNVPELFRIEEYATVFHLVSTVTGELDRDKGVVDLLAATFPGGSITGAPKVRAMEIIEELEPVRRGIYCGSIGYLGFDGDADLNIVIRTLVFTGGKIYFQVGGGITIDSDPDAEYLETLDKALALVRALGLAGDYPLAGAVEITRAGHYP